MTQPEKSRPAYEAPRAARMGELIKGKGACEPQGSGDSEYREGNDADPSSRMTGNSANGPCDWSGISASSSCSDPGTSASSSCNEPGSGVI